MEISEEVNFQAKSRRNIHLANDDGLGDVQGDDENHDPRVVSVKTEFPGGMKSKLKDRRSLMKRQGSSRRRRRSSARFLRMTPNGEGDDDGDQGHHETASSTNLGEVYRNAIRMNAENRINASNSWNLNLIDHLDRFVAPELRTGSDSGSGNSRLQAVNGKNLTSTLDSTMISGVNFTKASCTLDASVKIYSYRVDDVHLTSYKVLANLNRTDSSHKNGTNISSVTRSRGNGDDITDHDDLEESNLQSTQSPISATDTVEQNIANINMHKLDAAFDIDPLFHKMSKTFDEGGAKGLLLANLGVGTSGCNIVFDSSLETEDAIVVSVARDDRTAVNVSSLDGVSRDLTLHAFGNFNAVEKMPLVPQLASLRSQFEQLGKGGFVEETVASSELYASSREDEAEADKSIHLEAIERSRVSQADLGRSLSSRHSIDTYGSVCSNESNACGFAFSGDDEDVFEELHDEDHRFSSSSFEPARASILAVDDLNENHGPVTRKERKFDRPPVSQASVLLDAIASGSLSTTHTGNQYEYFNTQALDDLSSGNAWAGSEHWKKMPANRRRKAPPGNLCDQSSGIKAVAGVSKVESRKKKALKGKIIFPDKANVVSITRQLVDVKALLDRPKRGHGRKGNDTFQLTKLMHGKYSKISNLLPIDAGLEIKDLVTLFSRPSVSVGDIVKAETGISTNAKAVGFGQVETWGEDDDQSYGDNEDGEGYHIAGSYDEAEDFSNPSGFVVADLEGIRKVDKIKIGYATVARKVDVKRLKRDLWMELEQTFAHKESKKGESELTDGIDTVSILPDSDFYTSVEILTGNNDTSLSFQNTVKEMRHNQSQSDVTLPFYFICVLHLCNEKGLSLESCGLDDFIIHNS